MMKHPAQPPETTSETTVYPAKDKKQVQEGLTERPELDNQGWLIMTHLMAQGGFPSRRDVASAMGVHRASGASCPEGHLGPPQAGLPREQESPLAAQVAYLGGA